METDFMNTVERPWSMWSRFSMYLGVYPDIKILPNAQQKNYEKYRCAGRPSPLEKGHPAAVCIWRRPLPAYSCEVSFNKPKCNGFKGLAKTAWDLGVEKSENSGIQESSVEKGFGSGQWDYLTMQYSGCAVGIRISEITVKVEKK